MFSGIQLLWRWGRRATLGRHAPSSAQAGIPLWKTRQVGHTWQTHSQHCLGRHSIDWAYHCEWQSRQDSPGKTASCGTKCCQKKDIRQQPARTRLGHSNPLPRINAWSTRLISHYRPVGNYQSLSQRYRLRSNYQPAINILNVVATHRNNTETRKWSDDSASETEYTPQGFQRHPSNPYYIGNNKDNDNPKISLHAHDESSDDDSDPDFFPNQISILKSTMMDTLKEFQGSRDQRKNLNQALDDFHINCPGNRSVANQIICRVIKIPWQIQKQVTWFKTKLPLKCHFPRSNWLRTRLINP